MGLKTRTEGEVWFNGERIEHLPAYERVRRAMVLIPERRHLFPLIEQVNNDRIPVEIMSRRGNAVLISREDYDALEEQAKQFRPKLLVAGASAYPRQFDFPRLRAIADSVGALFMFDMAHVAGLIAGGAHPSPVPYADVITSTTHKTLRGPRGGLILCKEELAKPINSAVFPGVQGGPFMHLILAKVSELLRPRNWSLLLRDQLTGELYFKAAVGAGSEMLMHLRLQRGEGRTGDKPKAIGVERRLDLAHDPAIGPPDDCPQLGLGGDHVRKAAVRKRCRHLGSLFFPMQNSAGPSCVMQEAPRRRPCLRRVAAAL